MPVSPSFCPIFHAYDLTRSPPAECRLYVLKVWNRLCYSSQVVRFFCPFYRASITLDIIILRMSSFAIAILHVLSTTGKNNRFPFLDILGYLKNTHKNPKFGRVRQVPIRELGWEFSGWTCLTLPKLGFLWVFFKYPKISKNGNLLFFPVNKTKR